MTTTIDKNHSDMKTLNEHISAMLAKLIDTSSNTDNHEKQLIEISSKLSNYEDLLEKLSIKYKQIHPLSLHITEILSKLSAYKTLLDKLSISNINKFEAEMK